MRTRPDYTLVTEQATDCRACFATQFATVEQERLVTSDILIIDDDSAIRDMLAYYLRSRGFNALTASEGRSGIEICRNSKPGAVLCDLRMPGMDGLAVLAELTRDFPELPVLVVSGTGDLGDAIQTLKLG